LAKHVEAGSADAVENQAHRIKGAAATVNGEALRAAALEMEVAGKLGDLAKAELCLVKLSAEFLRLKEAITKHLSG
jgi:HPt (histidine-containing phosphotransfer) domain-containing protein